MRKWSLLLLGTLANNGPWVEVSLAAEIVGTAGSVNGTHSPQGGNRFEGRRDRGATAVEYGLLVGLIAIVMITGVALVGPKLSTMFTNVAGKL
jgi:pilus assembly protein Flp/PilA